MTATNSGALLVQVNRTGALAVRALRPPRGVELTSISCVRADACELAGDYFGGEITVVGWNGHRLGAIHNVAIPDESGFGNYTPEISCSGAWCKVSSDILVPGELEQNVQQLYLTTTHDGKPTESHWVTGYFGDVRCGGSANCYAILSNLSTPGTALARVTRGRVTHLEPISPYLAELACRGDSCIAAGADRIATFSAGRQTSMRSVAGVRPYTGVTLGPGRFFAAIGVGAHGGSVLTTGPTP